MLVPKKVINEDGMSKYNNGEHSDLHASVYHYLTAEDAAVINCTAADLDEYHAAQKAEEDLIGRQTASGLTADVNETDIERDQLFGYATSLIDTAAKCPMPTQKKAAQALQLILKPFRGVGKKALAQESTEIRSLIAQLQGAQANVDAIPGLAEAIVALETANNKVSDLMSQRTGSEQAKAEALEHRATTDNCYRYIEQRINATLILQPSDEVQRIVTEINNLLKRSNDVYNTRMGVIHAKDEKEQNN